MNIAIGEKIRFLRNRDARRQEDLAVALGVSPQAVSRWESGGGYPDMELLPAIANYFHVSIDELFGYSSDREEKLRNILERADDALNAQGDMTECVEMLRSAAEEFPSEPTVLIKLGYALNMHGWKKYGARSYTVDGSDYAYEDVDYNSSNVYWQEMVRVFERVLEADIPSDDRDVIVRLLIIICAKMGQNEKAKELANKQNSLFMSRECLLPEATEAEERDRYLGEEVIAMLEELSHVFFYAISTKVPLFTSEEGLRLYDALIKLYEEIFSDGRCGKAHMQLRDLSLNAALLATRCKADIDCAYGYFVKAFEHNRKYKAIIGTGLYAYSAPLVSKVALPSENFPAVPDDFWKIYMCQYFPKELVERIRADAEFAECFEY